MIGFLLLIKKSSFFPLRMVCKGKRPLSKILPCHIAREQEQCHVYIVEMRELCCSDPTILQKFSEKRFRWKIVR
jgi:hypothetical protein